MARIKLTPEPHPATGTLTVTGVLLENIAAWKALCTEMNSAPSFLMDQLIEQAVAGNSTSPKTTTAGDNAAVGGAGKKGSRSKKAAAA